MGKKEKEESSSFLHQLTKRTTRSSLSSSNKNIIPQHQNQHQHRIQRLIDSHPPPSILHDLVFGEEEESSLSSSISLDSLLSNFPGRRLQILHLLRLLGPLNCPVLPIFIYGGPSVGKTTVLLHIFRHLKRPFIYSSCRTCYNPRILFESTLNQLLLHRRNMTNAYSTAKRCDKPVDFVNFLQEALKQVITSLKGGQGAGGGSEEKQGGNGAMIYLIFDDIELLRDWDKHSTVISMLFKLYDILKVPQVGFIFISNMSPDTYYLNTGSVESIPVYFPDYTEDELYQIFLRDHASPKVYSSFLEIVLKPFCRITRRVDELSIAFHTLFQTYCKSLSDLELVPTEDMKRKLFTHLKPHIAPSLNEIFKVQSCHALEVESNKEKLRRKSNIRNVGDYEAPEDMDFHMSVSVKYLLISAFLASRNPATLDASLFDSTGGGDNRKRKRKNSQTTAGKNEKVEQDLLLKGPGTFPLERLLAIFQCITSVTEGSLQQEQQEDVMLGVESRDCGLMSDVLLQLSTLCNGNFICKGGSCPLEASTRYQSTVTEELALKVARSAKFPLSKYLYRR